MIPQDSLRTMFVADLLIVSSVTDDEFSQATTRLWLNYVSAKSWCLWSRENASVSRCRFDFSGEQASILIATFVSSTITTSVIYRASIFRSLQLLCCHLQSKTPTPETTPNLARTKSSTRAVQQLNSPNPGTPWATLQADVFPPHSFSFLLLHLSLRPAMCS